MGQPEKVAGSGLIKRLYRRVFGRPRFARFNGRLRYYGEIGLGVGYTTLQQSGEAQALAPLLRHLPPEPVIIDVGANRGDYAVLLRAARADARIIAFEPNPVPLTELKRRSQSDGFDVIEMACGAAEGIATLYDRRDSRRGACATLSASVGGATLGDDLSRTQVPVTTLDVFAARQGLDRVDFLKIDTEGWELPVLEGAARLIREGRIGWLAYEFCHHHVHTRTFMKDFHDLLPGWTFYRLLPHGLLPLGDYLPQHWEIFDWQNILVTAPGHGLPRAGR